MRIYPTHYTITTYTLKSWVVESSLDGLNWTEIDWKMNIPVGGCISFPFPIGRECRFIRITQIGENANASSRLVFAASEVFGALFEQEE
jgi:hypothetical protein